MTSFALTTAIASLVIFASFVVLGVVKFTLLGSYSAYAAKWTQAVPIHNMHLWSIVTIIAALLLMPAMIERGEGNLLQCLGFFAPLYLVVVGFTPEWETNKKQRIIHIIGTALCATAAFAWLLFIRHLWWVCLIALAVMCAAAYFTKSWKTSYIFWLEMVMFSSAYAAAIF